MAGSLTKIRVSKSFSSCASDGRACPRYAGVPTPDERGAGAPHGPAGRPAYRRNAVDQGRAVVFDDVVQGRHGPEVVVRRFAWSTTTAARARTAEERSTVVGIGPRPAPASDVRTGEQLDDGAAERPDVSGAGGALQLDDLWRHPVRRADDVLVELFLGLERARHAKVGQLDDAVPVSPPRPGHGRAPVAGSAGGTTAAKLAALAGPDLDLRMLAHLMSQWMTFWLWRYASPSMTCRT